MELYFWVFLWFQIVSEEKGWQEPKALALPRAPLAALLSPGTSLSKGPISWGGQCSRMERTRHRPPPPPLSRRRVLDLPMAKKSGSLLHLLAGKSLQDTSEVIMLSWQPFIPG